MLQQTQVKTVVDYWNRWMRELPDIRSVAKASSSRIHKLWEGLGYYTRARNLLRAARIIVRDHAGRFPTGFEQVLALPGIGRYTAGAICSIARNQPTPILDGNVIRVLTRLFGIGGDPRKSHANSSLWELAEELVQQASRIRKPRRACSHLNQSLMELGALVCTPKNPRCAACPVARFCEALRHGQVHNLPAHPRRPRTRQIHYAALVSLYRGRYLARQRPAGALNAHLWEFPNLELADPSTRNGAGKIPGPLDTDPARAARQAAANAFHMRPDALMPFCVIRHSITRYRIRLSVFRSNVVVPSGSGITGARWLSPSRLSSLPFTAAHKKVLARVLAAEDESF